MSGATALMSSGADEAAVTHEGVGARGLEQGDGGARRGAEVDERGQLEADGAGVRVGGDDVDDALWTGCSTIMRSMVCWTLAMSSGPLFTRSLSPRAVETFLILLWLNLPMTLNYSR